MDPLTELRSRDSYEDTVAAYTTMQAELRAEVTRVVPTVEWIREREPSRSGCGRGFGGLGGKSLFLDSWGAPGAIPDDRWAAAVQAATGVVDRYGFDTTQTLYDEPGDHSVRFVNSTTGAYIDFGTAVNVAVTTKTGCHIPAGPLPTIDPP